MCGSLPRLFFFISEGFCRWCCSSHKRHRSPTQPDPHRTPLLPLSEHTTGVAVMCPLPNRRSADEPIASVAGFAGLRTGRSQSVHGRGEQQSLCKKKKKNQGRVSKKKWRARERDPKTPLPTRTIFTLSRTATIADLSDWGRWEPPAEADGCRSFRQ